MGVTLRYTTQLCSLSVPLPCPLCHDVLHILKPWAEISLFSFKWLLGIYVCMSVYVYQCVCMCVSVCMCVHVCAHVCNHVCVSVSVYMCPYVHVCICIYGCVYLCACVYQWVHTYIHQCVCARACIWRQGWHLVSSPIASSSCFWDRVSLNPDLTS